MKSSSHGCHILGRWPYLGGVQARLHAGPPQWVELHRHAREVDAQVPLLLHGGQAVHDRSLDVLHTVACVVVVVVGGQGCMRGC